MADMSWNKATQSLQVNSHEMSGKPMSVPYDDSFQVPLSDDRQEKVKAILSELYPDQDIEIIGAPWDYSLTEAPDLHNNTAIGHYRVRIDGDKEAVLCVNVNDSSQGISLGGRLFERFRAANIGTMGPVRLPNGDFTQQVSGGVFAHIEEFDSTALTLFNTKLDGRQYQLGILVAQIANVSFDLDDDLLDEELAEFSNATTMRSYDRGMEIIKGADDLASAVKDVMATIDTGTNDHEATFQSLAKSIHLLPLISRNGYAVGTFNMIEKTVIDYGADDFSTRAYDAVARGYVPMPTANTTHDFGFAVARIISDPARYGEGDPEIACGLTEFIDGYNAETGKKVTVAEAIKSAKTTIAFNTVQGIGYNDLVDGGTPQTTEDFARHIATNVLPVIERLDAMAPSR